MQATHSLQGGFADPSHAAAHAFRAIMEATARPGQIQQISGAEPPAPLSIAAGTAILTLCDTDTPIYLAGDADCPAVRDWVTFHTGAPITPAEACMFAIGAWPALQPFARYPIGTPDYPDRSATLIVDLPDLTPTGAALRGPGIRDVGALSLPEVACFQANAALYPLGLDFLFCCDTRIAALPRTTQVQAPPPASEVA